MALVGFILVTGNVGFFHQLTAVYPISLTNAGFLLSLAVLVSALIVLLYSLFSLMIGNRLAAILLLLTTCMAAYFTDQFGLVIDYTMIDNVMQTDSRETQGLLSGSMLLCFVAFGVLPAAVLLRIPTLQVSRWHEWRRSGFLGLAAFLVAITSLTSFSDHYASFFREHKSVRYYVNPINPVFAISKYAARRLQQPIDTILQPILTDVQPSTAVDARKLVVMVVGETARSDRFSLNGYHRETNPHLNGELGLVSYPDVQSCGTSTAISVPCMFALSGQDHFEVATGRYTENALDVLQRAGIKVLWRDNNSDSKGVALRVAYEDFRDADRNPICDSECRDIGMLDGLQDYIDMQQSGDILIVLHQMGNHGPAYAERYPAEFEYFTPACQSNELSTCSQTEIDNAYDNAIRYTDYFLSEVITLLKDNTAEYDATMMYVSDHGESLGENGVFLHGMPYMIAPVAQRNVPVIVWEENHRLASEPAGIYSHDDVFKSLLTTFGVKKIDAIRGRSFLAERNKVLPSDLVSQGE